MFVFSKWTIATFFLFLSFCFSANAQLKTIPVIKWKFETPFGAAGRIWENSSSKDGTVYFASTDSNVYALDIETGEKKWNFKTNGPLYCEIAIYNDYLYAGSDDGYLYKLNQEDGTEIWKFNIHEEEPLIRYKPDDPINTNRGFDFHGPSAIESDDIVYVGSPDTYLYAIDADSGTKKWKFKTNDIVRSAPAIESDKIVFGSYDGNLYAVNKTTGESEWIYNSGTPITTSPLIFNGNVYIGNRSSMTVGGVLISVNIETGARNWSLSWGDGSWVESDATLYDSTLYLGSSFWGNTVSVNLETRNFNWTKRVNGGAYSNASLKDDSHYSGTVGMPNSFTGNRNLTSGSLLKINRHTAEELWRYSFSPIPGYTEWGISAQPELVDSLILVGGLDGNFYAFEERLKRIQKFEVAGDPRVEFNKPSQIYWETIEGSSVFLNGNPISEDTVSVTITSDTTFVLIATLDNIADTSYLNIQMYYDYELNRALQKQAFRNDENNNVLEVTEVNDGDNRTYINGVVSDSQWVYVDLVESFNIKRIYLNWRSTNRASNYRIDVSDDAENWTTIISIENESGSTDDITGLESSGRYVRLVVKPGVEFRLNEMQIYNAIEDVTDINENKTGLYPLNFFLEQNYPNPFNPNTKINFSIPLEETVTLKIYSMLGEEIATLINERKKAGTYQLNFDASKLSSGIYIYTLIAGNLISSKKMILMK